jgi:transcriptional regulator with PAS, ATPase and Fis domain
MNILLTFTGFHDPYSPGSLESENQPGPILSLLAARNFDQVFLISTPNTFEITEKTKQAIGERFPGLAVEVREIDLAEPTDYRGIIKGLREHISGIKEAHIHDNLFVAVASGTPQMHACWLMLVASGELPAKILHSRPPRFVTADRPLVSEIDLSSEEFPTVRYFSTSASDDAGEQDLDDLKIKTGIVGDHESMQMVLNHALAFARADAPLLIYGETGTGKDLLAKFIHNASSRSSKRIVIVNCGAIPETLIESTLFGHVRGAFTGATTDQLGKFREADGGTLFLDEIGDLPLSVQVKILRVVQDGVVDPVGGGREYTVDVRIIGATNQNLQRMIKKGTFREDLYFRLNTGEVLLPPLRDRRTDIAPIALRVLDQINRTSQGQKRLTTEALMRLQLHNWPGNIRELVSVLKRSVLMSAKSILDADDLLLSSPVTYEDPLQALPEPHPGFELDGFLKSARKQLFLRALELSNGNQSDAARMLGITPQAVYKFMQQLKDSD